MRRIRHFLGQTSDRKSHKRNRSKEASRTRRVGTAIETLEPRQLLAANILATVDGSLLTAGEIDQIDLNVAGNSAILGFRVQGTGGTLDPDAVVIKDLANHTIAPREANADVDGSTDSLVLAELGVGSFTVATRAENATTGVYRVDVFLPGDISGDGLVDANELMRAQAAVIQSMGSWNHVTQAYYAKHGIDLTKNLYEQELDCDGDGRISNIDLGVVTINAAAGPLSITLINDAAAPVIQAGLANDTGASTTDGITNNATIIGTIQDEHAVVEFLAGIDGMDPSQYVSVLAEVDATGHFEFDLARLEDIAGAPLANNGAHTLYLIATDEYDNVSDPFEVEFTLDTIAPEVPTGLDLIAASDLGFSNTDNVTSDNTPTVAVDGPSGAVIKLYSSVNGKVGQATAASTVSITASALSNGVHQLTATATDVAGNESAASTPLAVTIDTVAPAVPTLALAAADNTGNPDDNRTEKTNVRLEGATEAGARVTFNGTTTIDTATGAYGFDAIPLAFGTNHFTISAMDPAGNVSNNSADVIQNNLPTLGTPIGPIDLNEDPGAKNYSLAALFDDANLAQGDTLTLSIANSNPTLVTASLSGTSGQIHNSQLQLVFGANKFGTAVLTITATDSIGETIQTTITVNVAAVNDTPVAAADNYQVEVDGQLTVNAANGVLANDLDVEGTALTAVLGTTTQHGNLTLNPNGSFTYTPAAGYEGTDSFTYTASDGELSSAVTTVTIQVIANHLPTALPDGPYSVDEDGSLAQSGDRNVLANDSDEDGDSIAAVAFTGTSVKGAAVTVFTNGTFTYNTNGAFQSLAAGESTDDTFNYTVRDSRGGESTGTVTIHVVGSNDAPTANPDPGHETNANTPISIDVLANDTDPDVNDILSVTGTFPMTTAKGATVTKNVDGTLKYDPTTSGEFAALQTGQFLSETFTYTMTDNHGSQKSSTVTVKVLGVTNQAPQVVQPGLADMELIDETSPLTTTIALAPHFTDPDGDGLVYTATSSNTQLVEVTVSGNNLLVTYKPYSHTQNRTPAVITVRATENAATALWVEDTFTVTVQPEQPIEVYLVVRETATPSGDTQVATLPTSIDTIAVGSNYVVEIWMRDLWDATVSGGPSPGLTGGQFDLHYLTDRSNATALNYEGAFFSGGIFDTGTINDASGLVNDFGAGTLSSGVGVSSYARLGYVTFTASTAGQQTFTLDDPQAARIALGLVNTTHINLGEPVSVNQVAEMTTRTFDLTDSNTMTVTGMINGATIVAPPLNAPANTAVGVEDGSFQVALDNLDNPTAIQFQTGSVDITTNEGDGPFRPGVGGVDGTAYGDFELQAGGGTTELVEMAIRDLTLDISSDVLTVFGFEQFVSDEVQMSVGSGWLDIRSPSIGEQRFDLSGLLAVPVETIIQDMGTLVETEGVYTLSFNYERHIDISGFSTSIQAGSYLTIYGHIEVQFSTTGLIGTAVGDTVETGTGLAMTLSQSPTTVSAGGQIAVLPTSETWINEWDSYWVEIWAKTDEAAGVAGVKVDLSYNPNYFTATQIDHGPAFIHDAGGSLDTDGLVLGLGGATSRAEVGGSCYVLVGRVKFESIGADSVDLDFNDLMLGPHDLGLSLDNVAVDLVDLGAADATVWQTPGTELWAVPYDVDNDGKIGLGDLSFFAASYGDDTIETESAMAAALDFDLDGKVGLGDLSFLASNYGLARGGDGQLTLPESFTRQWIGAGLDVEGDATVADVLDLAIGDWQEALGLNEPIAIQLVVRDFDSAQLAEAVILEVGPTGIPTSGRVILDDNANGLGWSTQLDGEPAEGQYDLYTVLLHEIGHTLGFTSSYEGFAEHLTDDADGTVFVAAGISVDMDAVGNHVAGAALAGDLMSATLDPGARKAISDLNVQMLLAAYETALAGAFGHSTVGAALTASNGPAAELAPTSTSTADFNVLGDRLEGDVTWDQILRRHSGPSLTADAVDWFLMAPLATEDAAKTLASPSARRETSDDPASDSLLAEWAATPDARQTEIDAADSLMAKWEDWSA